MLNLLIRYQRRMLRVEENSLFLVLYMQKTQFYLKVFSFTKYNIKLRAQNIFRKLIYIHWTSCRYPIYASSRKSNLIDRTRSILGLKLMQTLRSKEWPWTSEHLWVEFHLGWPTSDVGRTGVTDWILGHRHKQCSVQDDTRVQVHIKEISD